MLTLGSYPSDIKYKYQCFLHKIIHVPHGSSTRFFYDGIEHRHLEWKDERHRVRRSDIIIKGTVRQKNFFLLLMKYQQVVDVVVKFYICVTCVNGF